MGFGLDCARSSSSNQLGRRIGRQIYVNKNGVFVLPAVYLLFCMAHLIGSDDVSTYNGGERFFFYLLLAFALRV
jgi:hypothetical protein